jgi:predicted GIY-YIG superfamily endonuclease
MSGTVYLLHFSESYKHAAHYLGWTSGPLEERLRQHQSGTGARLIEVVTNTGITFELARTWSGSRKDERGKKRQGGAGMLCPICRTAGLHRRRRRQPRVAQ